jgi:hypothetical protein
MSLMDGACQAETGFGYVGKSEINRGAMATPSQNAVQEWPFTPLLMRNVDIHR